MDNTFSFAATFNKGVNFEVDTNGMQFVSLKWLYDNYKGHIFAVRGMFINTKGNYGPTPVIISSGALVNLPEHCTVGAQMILVNPQAIDAINGGKVGFIVYEYESKNPKAKGKKGYSIRYVDLTDNQVTTYIEVSK